MCLVDSLAVCSVSLLLLLCVGFCLVGHVVFVGYRAQQCDLNPDLLRILEDGYVSKCCDVTSLGLFFGVVMVMLFPGGPLVFSPDVTKRVWSVDKMEL